MPSCPLGLNVPLTLHCKVDLVINEIHIFISLAPNRSRDTAIVTDTVIGILMYKVVKVALYY